MTKPEPLPEILSGPDGEKAYISKIDFDTVHGFFVGCGWYGFRGPLEDTRAAAILAWNRVMASYHAGKKGARK